MVVAEPRSSVDEAMLNAVIAVPPSGRCPAGRLSALDRARMASRSARLIAVRLSTILRSMSAARLLRHARRRARLWQRSLGDAAGIPQSRVPRIEHGTLPPRVEPLERLLRAAGQTLSSEPRLGQ